MSDSPPPRDSSAPASESSSAPAPHRRVLPARARVGGAVRERQRVSRAVLLADPRGAAAGDEAERDAGEAVRDRLFRACSGRIVPLRDAEGDGETN